MEKTPSRKNILENSPVTAGGNVHIGDVIYKIEGVEKAIPRHLTNNIPTHAEGIIGRDTELVAIEKALTKRQPTVLVNGIGGIGKTSVAVKYIAHHLDDYQHFAWLTVTSSLIDAFINNNVLIESLGISAKVRELIEAKQPGAAFEWVFKKLNDLEKTMVVVDNANDSGELIQYKRLFDTAHVHFLITSRTKPEAWQIIPVGILAKEEAAELFYSHFGNPGLPVSDIEALLEKLDYHTLLIELVAKSAKASGISFDHLHKIIREKFIHDPELNKRSIPTGAHGDSLADNAKRARVEEYIWLIFQNITQLRDGDKEMLRAFVLLPVATLFEEDFIASHFQLLGIALDIYDGLDRLTEGGWLEKLGTLEQASQYKIHPLISEVVLKHLVVDVEFAKPFIDHINNLIDYDNTKIEDNLFEKRSNQYLAERLSHLFYKIDNESVSFLLDRLAYLEQNFGFYEKAVKLNERALQICENIFEEGNPKIAVRQSNLANLYNLLGHHDRALILIESALKSDIKNFGVDHWTVALRLNILANVYRSLGQYQNASKHLERALEINLNYFDQHHPRVAVIQSNLANVYRELGQYDEAVLLLETTLHSSEVAFGYEHPSVAVRKTNLANVYYLIGRYELALVLFESALKITILNFGKDHPEVSVIESNLANVYLILGNNEKAIILLNNALHSTIENFGTEHPGIPIIKTNLANSYYQLGQYDKSLEILKSSLDSTVNKLGKKHPNVAIIQSSLAWVYKKLGNIEEAKLLWNEAYQNNLKNLGSEHPHTISLQKWATEDD